VSIQSAEQNSCDLNALKSLAETNTRETRSSLFDQMSHLAYGTRSPMNEREREAAADILLGLLRDAAPDARAVLAQRLTASTGVPQDLLRALAFDDDAVARPIILHCLELCDDDIAALICEGSPAHRRIVTRREGLSERLSDLIVDCDDIELTENLAANTTAHVSAATFNKMATKSETSQPLCKLMLERGDLPPIVAHRMFWWVRGATRQRVLANHAVDLEDLESILDEACRNGLVRPPPLGSFRQFTDLIAGRDYLPISGLLTILRQGSLEHFARALCERMAIDRRTALRITRDPGGEAIALACRAMRVEKGQFLTMFFLMDFLRFGKARPLSDLRYVEAAYDQLPQSRAKASVALWDTLEQAGEA